MKPITITALLTSSLLGSAMMMTACQSSAAVSAPLQSADMTPVMNTDTQPVTFDLKSGQVLQFVLSEVKSGDVAKASRRTYYQTALPLAQQFGLERLGQLQITETVVGTVNPTGLAFFRFPDENSLSSLRADADWPDYKAQRAVGWDELMIFSTTLDADLSIRFDPTKHYTLAIAWENPDNPDDYAQYLDRVEQDFDVVGARFIKKFRNIGYEDHNKPEGAAPDQLILVEWETKSGLDELLGSDSYEENSIYFQRGIEGFQFYRLEVPTPS